MDGRINADLHKKLDDAYQKIGVVTPRNLIEILEENKKKITIIFLSILSILLIVIFSFDYLSFIFRDRSVPYELQPAQVAPQHRQFEEENHKTNSNSIEEITKKKKREISEYLSPFYKNVADVFVISLKNNFVCSKKPKVKIECSSGWDNLSDDIVINEKSELRETIVSLSKQIQIESHGNNGIYADVLIKDDSKSDIVIDKDDHNGVLKNTIISMMIAFGIPSAVASDELYKCRSKHDIDNDKLNWNITKIKGTLVQCVFYGPNFRDSGESRFFKLKLFKEIL